MRDDAVVALEGARNCRDLGGYDTQGGERVRTGLLFRSDRLSGLTDSDLQTLESLRIRTVVDFRGRSEAQRHQSRLPAGVTAHVHLPIGSSGDPYVDAQATLAEQALAGKVRSITPADMARMYLRMLDNCAQQFTRLADLVADPQNLPLLFHCTAGKDRTGVAAALLLEILGVPRQVVLDDYCLTDELRTPHRITEVTPVLARQGIKFDDVAAMFSAPRDTMHTLLAELDSRHPPAGGESGRRNGRSAAEALLVGAGLDPGVPQLLRANLLT